MALISISSVRLSPDRAKQLSSAHSGIFRGAWDGCGRAGVARQSMAGRVAVIRQKPSSQL